MSTRIQKILFFFSLFLIMNACSSDTKTTEEVVTEGVSVEEEKKQVQHVVDTLKPYENEKAMTTEKKSEGEQTTFIGEFIYMADAAVFFECGSNRKMAVLFQKDFIELEKTYRKVMGEDVGQRAYIVVDAELKPKDIDQEGLDWALIINDVQSVTKGIKCTAPVQKFEGVLRIESGRLILKDCATAKDIKLAQSGAYLYMMEAFQKSGAKYLKVNVLATVREGDFIVLQLEHIEAESACE